MTEETLEKAIILDEKIIGIKRIKNNIEHSTDFVSLAENLKRAGLDVNMLGFEELKGRVLRVVNDKLSEALKELEAL